MRRFFQISISFLLLLTLVPFSPKVLAYTNNFCNNPTDVKIDQNNSFNTILTIDTKSNLNMKGLAGDTVQVKTDIKTAEGLVPSNGIISVSLGKSSPGTFVFDVWEGITRLCNGSFTVPDVGQGGNSAGTNIIFTPSNPTSKDTINAKVQNLPEEGEYYYSVYITANPAFMEKNIYDCGFSRNKVFEFNIPARPGGIWSVLVMKKNSNSCSGEGSPLASGTITISSSPVSLPDLPNATPLPLVSLPQCGNWIDSKNVAIPLIDGSQEKYLKKELDAGRINMDYIKQLKCASIDTALGQISTDPASFVKSIFTIVLGLSGGIALILIIISGYKFMASQGNPEAVKAATEGLTSAIVGLLFIIFAFVILQIVGVDILRIPGFNP